MNFLIDYNLRGQAALLWSAIAMSGWLELIPMRFVDFEEVGLVDKSDDRIVWQCAQARQMILLTDNRNKKGRDSLEQVIREENTLTSLPVVTIGKKASLDERRYRDRCAIRLIEILLDIENHRGVGRIYIP